MYRTFFVFLNVRYRVGQK